MLENKTIQGYKYIKVDNVNIAYLSAVIPSNGMGTLSVNVQVMSKDMLENNKEYFLEEYNKFKKDVEEEANINCGWNVFAKEENEIVEEQPSENENEDNIEIKPPVDEEIKEEIPNEEPKDEIIEEGDLDEDIMVKEGGVEYPSDDLDNEMFVEMEGVEYPEGDLDEGMFVTPKESIYENIE